MKKIISALAVLLISCSVMAQYKKASIFGKQGRTYEVGTQFHMLGTGQGTRPGFSLGFGRDQDGQRLFYNWELEYLPSYNYSFETTDIYNNQPVSVQGTTTAALLYTLNYGYFLLKNDDAARRVKPYLFAGLNMVLLGNIKDETTSPNGMSTTKESAWPSYNTGIGGGAGCVINLSEKVGVKVFGAYTRKFMFDTDMYSTQDKFQLFGSHPYGGITLRFRIVSE